MGRSRLTPEQAEAFRKKVWPMLRFLCLCQRRLDAAGFDPNSKFYQAVAEAYDAIHGLHVELHYESCGHGVGRPPTDEHSGPGDAASTSAARAPAGDQPT